MEAAIQTISTFPCGQASRRVLRKRFSSISSSKGMNGIFVNLTPCRLALPWRGQWLNCLSQVGRCLNIPAFALRFLCQSDGMIIFSGFPARIARTWNAMVVAWRSATPQEFTGVLAKANYRFAWRRFFGFINCVGKMRARLDHLPLPKGGNFTSG